MTTRRHVSDAPLAETEATRLGSGAMFDAIARRYDLLNRVLSLGIDGAWRRAAIDAVAPDDGLRIVDVATGTADLAIGAAKRRAAARVVGVDPSGAMLSLGARKAERRGVGRRVTLQRGDALALPFDDDSFDGAMIGFGIRNVPDRERALGEMARVTRAGGRVVVLELAEPRGNVFGRLARLHVRHVVPWIGALLSGPAAYRYLQRSIEAFPPAERFVEEMESVGLRVRSARPLTFGACWLYVAEPVQEAK